MKTYLLILTLLFSLTAEAQQIIDLYPGAIPNSRPYPDQETTKMENGRVSWIKQISHPTLTLFLPPKANATGAGVIICPGGGYTGESYWREGTIIAEAFLSQGIAAFILKYRLPDDSIMPNKAIGPLQDAQQAIKIVRQRAQEWQLNPTKIGIMGFSAGGHLASTAGTHFQKSYIPNDEQVNLRPDFMILVYPVIMMQDEVTHSGSRTNLLGPAPSQEQKNLFSNELHVGPNTPPTWLTHAGDDTVVPVENSIRFYQQLIQHKVPAEMHLYPKGNHGFVLKLPTYEWMKPLFDWMKKSGLMS